MSKSKNRRPLALARLSSAQTIPIDIAARKELRDAFLDLAKRAEYGLISGVVYSAIDCAGRIRHGTLGRAQSNVPLAHYAASRLVDCLLHLDEPYCD